MLTIPTFFLISLHLKYIYNLYSLHNAQSVLFSKLKVHLHMEYIEKDESSGVAVAVGRSVCAVKEDDMKEEKKELDAEEECLGRVGVEMADAGIDGLEDARTDGAGVLIA
jgi:hypothetical protein